MKSATFISGGVIPILQLFFINECKNSVLILVSFFSSKKYISNLQVGVITIVNQDGQREWK